MSASRKPDQVIRMARGVELRIKDYGGEPFEALDLPVFMDGEPPDEAFNITGMRIKLVSSKSMPDNVAKIVDSDTGETKGWIVST